MKKKLFLFFEICLFVLVVVFSITTGIKSTSAWNTVSMAGKSWTDLAIDDGASYAILTASFGADSNDYPQISSLNGFTSWSSLVSLTEGGSEAVDINDSEVLLAIGGNLWLSLDAANGWGQMNSAGSGNWTAVAVSDSAQYMLAGDYGSYLYISSSGDNFAQKSGLGTKNWTGVDVSDDGQYMVAVADNSQIFVSNNYGDTWQGLSVGGGNRFWKDVQMSSSGQYIVASDSSEYVWLSDDYGATWSSLSNLGGGNWYSADISDDAQRIIVAENGGYIYYSNDHGDTWHPQTTLGIANWTHVVITSDGVQSIAVQEAFTHYQVFDATGPNISSVSSNKPNGSYKVGDVIDIDVVFSKTVTSSGSVTITLETGDTDRTCSFTVSNSTTGTCNYTVQSGDISSDLDVTNIAGTIYDSSFNLLTSNIPVTNLSLNKNIVIDTTAPVVEITSPTDAAIVSGSSVSVVASSTDTNLAGIQFFSGTDTSLGSEDTSAPYSVTWDTTGLSNGDYDLFAVARDSAGNYATSSVITVTVNNTVPDTTPPVRSNGSPSGTLSAGTTEVYLELDTNENASCHYSITPDTDYGDMVDSFSTDGTNHSSLETGLSAGTYTYYVKCEDSLNNENTDDYEITFSIASVGGGDNNQSTSSRKGSVVVNRGTSVVSNAIQNTRQRALSLYENLLKVIDGNPEDKETIVDLVDKILIEMNKLVKLGQVGITPFQPNQVSNTEKESTVIFDTDLQIAVRNPKVKILQIFLNSKGYLVAQSGPGSKGNETDMFGYATKSALARFQKDHNISPAVGYFGPKTRSLVNSLLN